jgi:hypothetical protein
VGFTQVCQVELERCIFQSVCSSLLSSGFTAGALVLFYKFLKYIVFHYFIALSTVFICISSWLLWLFMYQGPFRIDRSVSDLKCWRIPVLELKVVPHSSISKVHMCLGIALYRWNFLTTDRVGLLPV